MATTQDMEDGGSAESNEPADDEATQVANFEAVKEQLSAEVDAIDEDGDKLKEFILALNFQQGVNREASSAVQQVVRRILNALIKEHDEVTVAEAGDALWSELLFMRRQFLEQAAAGGADESEADDEGGGGTQTTLGALEELEKGSNDTDEAVAESKADPDPAFQ
jgi:hypothetical protein